MTFSLINSQYNKVHGTIVQISTNSDISTLLCNGLLNYQIIMTKYHKLKSELIRKGRKTIRQGGGGG